MPHKLQWIYSIPLIGGVLIFQMGKCVCISDRWFLRWPEFTGDWPLLFSVFWIIFQGFQNCLGLSFNKALNQLYFRPHCSIFQLLCPNAVRNSGVKQVETKAVHSQSVTFGPSFISAVSVCFNEGGSSVKRGLLGLCPVHVLHPWSWSGEHLFFGLHGLIQLENKSGVGSVWKRMPGVWCRRRGSARVCSETWELRRASHSPASGTVQGSLEWDCLMI